ncbi:FUSC family protein [Streptomyces sp. NBC_01198]|uniref:FUSC family protein n=1 Tax=Streptomyces sp. NBC_01198 TaxID=2903769 RepID=UPI002E154C31|nr:FUSC family protein [Streptomyces sp. NBC_01198]
MGRALADRLRLLDPGRVRLRTAARTILAALAALLAALAMCRAADLPGGIVVIATVVAVMVSRTLHATSLAHRLSALLYVPAIGLLAGYVGRFMLHHAWWGAAMYVAAVGASRYLLRFGGHVRRLGRLALTPLIAVMVVPVPPSAAKATGPVWGAVAGATAVVCVLLSQAVLPARPTREAAAAARDLIPAARRLRALAPGTPGHARAALALHRAALTAEDRLDAAAVPVAASAALADLAAAVLHAEVLAHTPAAVPQQRPVPAGDAVPSGPGPGAGPGPAFAPVAGAVLPDGALTRALAEVEAAAAAVRAVPAREHPAPEPARPPARKGLQPHTRLSVQLTAAMGAAFAVGHLLFPHHWTWTVITAFVVCSAARARGDVVHRSGLRVAGAFSGAVTGTVLAHLVAGVPPAAVAVIFCYLFVGVWLRDVSYAVWAFCVTSLLAVLYSLNGEQGSALLLQRPEGILAGSACGILAAYFVLPLRTETVMRGRAARALQILQDLLTAVRQPHPEPAALRKLARALDRAARDLSDAAASARAHRALLGRRAAEGAAPHAADWADTLAECVREARALAATPPPDLAAARAHLVLTAGNLGQVRRRLGHRPDAEPPRLPTTAPPPHLHRLNAALTDLYHQLPART